MQTLRESVGDTAARLMAGMAVAAMILYPLDTVASFLIPGELANELHFDAHDLCALDTAGVPLPFRLGAMLFALFAAGFVEWALFSTWRLMRLYARGAVFTQAAFDCMSTIAVALFASVVVGIALRLPISLILSWPLGKGQRYFAMSFGSDDALMLFSAAAVFVIARLMAGAHRRLSEIPQGDGPGKGPDGPVDGDGPKTGACLTFKRRS